MCGAKKIKLLIFAFLLTMFVFLVPSKLIFASETDVVSCYLEGEYLKIGSQDTTFSRDSSISLYSIPKAGITVLTGDRVNEFNTNKYPEITCMIKYIKEDASNGDSRGPDGDLRRRYVYCLEHFKNAPVNQTFTMNGYENTMVFHVIYHGATFYGELSRNPSHSTGNWKFDYLATQMAVCAVRNEFTLSEIVNSINASSATSEQKNSIITAITNMVNDALIAKNNADYGFDSNGWFRMDKVGYFNFTLNKESDEWTYGTDGYVYSGWISPVLMSKDGYYVNSEISYLETNTSPNVEIEKKYPDSCHSPYRLKVSNDTFSAWKKTGMTVTAETAIRTPLKWKSAIFVPANNKDFQKITFPIYEDINTYKTFKASVAFHIEKEVANYDIQVMKKSDDGTLLNDVEFSLFFKNDLLKPIQVIKTQDGIAKFSDLESNQEYVLKETKQADGYPMNSVNRIQLEISSDVDEEGELFVIINDVQYSYEQEEESAVYIKDVEGVPTLYLNIVNERGLLLPETGSYKQMLLIGFGLACILISIRKKEVKKYVKK